MEQLQQPEFIQPHLNLEVITSDPSKYQEQLMVLIKGLPITSSVQDVIGLEAESLVGFCLDYDNIDIVDESLTRVLDGDLEQDDLIKALTDINKSSNNLDPFKVKLSDIEKEKILRKRLLAWVDFLDREKTS